MIWKANFHLVVDHATIKWFATRRDFIDSGQRIALASKRRTKLQAEE